MDPKWLIVEVVPQRGCRDRWDAVIGRIGVDFAPFVISFDRVKCFVCIRMQSGIFLVLELERRPTIQVGGFDSLASLRKMQLLIISMK